MSKTPDLQDLRDKLLAPRTIKRDAQGFLTHPAMPIGDEGVRADDLLAVFGIEAAFVCMESDAPDEVTERYFDTETDPSCADWTPTPPAGDGWALLEIYDTENGPYALFGRAMPPGAWPRHSAGRPFDFYAHLKRQAEFSCKTFGPGRRTQGVIDHIKKELREIAGEPDSIEEWIDVVILALDGAWRAGASPEQIVSTLVAKQAKNEARDWPDWRTADPNKAIEHSKPKKRRIYISGPMSGLPEHNFPAFHAEAARLRELGYDVVNPADLNPDPGKGWKDCLRVDLLELLGCDAIAMLPGWQKSEGAHLEMHVAHRVGIEILDATEIQAPADAVALAA